MMLAMADDRRRRLLQVLADRRLVDDGALQRAEQVAGRTGQPVEQVLNQLGSLTDDDLVEVYAEAVTCAVWSPAEQPVEADLAGLGLTQDFLRRSRMLILQGDGAKVACAACDPLDAQALASIAFATRRPVEVFAARPGDWRRAFDLAFSTGPAPSGPGADERRLERDVDQIVDLAGDGSGARAVALAFEAALAVGASDIHFEPRRNDLNIRFRVDGRMVEHQVLPAALASPVVSRVKVIANLDLGEKRLPQDGRTSFIVTGREVDVRVSTSPTVFGESAVLRILDRAGINLNLDELGLSPPLCAVLRSAARTPHGIFLVTGPTGSGKTTTLYALLESFQGSGKKVLSVEDPVEFHFEHVSQTQIAPAAGLTFARALRSFLRQDPDIIMVGEIRDAETAAVAIQAAMTGHFVIASVHANTALAVVPRLTDMGIERYQLAASLRGCFAQRLVRRLCPHCKTRREAEATEREFLARQGFPDVAEVFAADGCPRCARTGFKGRVPIGEAFLASESLLRTIAETPGADLEPLAIEGGFSPIGRDGAQRILEGVTTVAEVMAVVDVA